ncbi:MAG: ABC transporter ATP-binding protein, partial [Cyanobacteria bacterium NC_groundwater_1444_Ag_S-0.65um_54_12]|nr:ABC transporter ATP-binding protein [Cyanobacteria bacterium NC_groundwater_1444_Ag_S-0.65um_54_12]
GMVHQHFQLVGTLTVAQNILLGCEPRQGFFFAERKASRLVNELAERIGLPIDPTAKVEQLPVGLQQRVEILKVLQRNAKILIFDEPTAVLTPQEIEELGMVMQRLAQAGKAIVFITHKLREVMAFATAITVMRAGRVVGRVAPSDTDTRHLAALVVGRPLAASPDEPPCQRGEVLLEVRGLSCNNDRHLPALDNVSLDVHAGECVGIIGVAGNGQSELVEVLTGLRRPEAGLIRLAGEDVTKARPRKLRERKVGHVAEDRLRRAIIKTFSVADNLVLDSYYRPPFCQAGMLDKNAILSHARALIARYQIKVPGPKTPINALSGGNQQKVVVARELAENNQLLIISQPTRGVDAGAAEFIHEQIRARKKSGVGILLVTNELDELMTLADRLAVIYRGRIVTWRLRGELGRDMLGKLMIGGQTTGELPHA